MFRSPKIVKGFVFVRLHYVDVGSFAAIHLPKVDARLVIIYVFVV